MNERIRNGIQLLLAALLALSFVGYAAATADGSTSVTTVGSSTFAQTVAATKAVSAGTIYNLNIADNSITNYWAAAWGNVSGSVQLRNSNGKDFVTWNYTAGTPQNSSAQNINALVLAYNMSTTPNFGATLATRSGANIDTITNVPAGLTDSATNTFNKAGVNFVLGNQSIPSVASSLFYGYTFSGNSSNGTKVSGDSLYWTAAVNDGTSNLMFVSPAQPIIWPNAGTSKLMFDNASSANYEMLLYVNNSGGTAALTYSFYAELR